MFLVLEDVVGGKIERKRATEVSATEDLRVDEVPFFSILSLFILLLF